MASATAALLTVATIVCSLCSLWPVAAFVFFTKPGSWTRAAVTPPHGRRPRPVCVLSSRDQAQLNAELALVDAYGEEELKGELSDVLAEKTVELLLKCGYKPKYAFVEPYNNTYAARDFFSTKRVSGDRGVDIDVAGLGASAAWTELREFCDKRGPWEFVPDVDEFTTSLAKLPGSCSRSTTRSFRPTNRGAPWLGAPPKPASPSSCSSQEATRKTKSSSDP